MATPYYRTQVQQKEELESPARAALRALLVGGASFIPQAASALLSTSLQPGGTLGDALSSSASLQQRADKSSSEAALKMGQADYYAGVNPTALKKSRMTQQTEQRGQDFAKETTQRGQDKLLEGQELAADRELAGREFSQYVPTAERAARRGWEPGKVRPVKQGGGGGGGGGGGVKTSLIPPDKVFQQFKDGTIAPIDLVQQFLRGDSDAVKIMLRNYGGNITTNQAEQLATMDGRRQWLTDNSKSVVATLQTDRRGNMRAAYQPIDPRLVQGLWAVDPPPVPGPAAAGGSGADAPVPADLILEPVDLHGSAATRSRPPEFSGQSVEIGPAAKAGENTKLVIANQRIKAQDRIAAMQHRGVDAAKDARVQAFQAEAARANSELASHIRSFGANSPAAALARQKVADAEARIMQRLDELEAAPARQGVPAQGAPGTVRQPQAQPAPQRAQGYTREEIQAAINAGLRSPNLLAWAQRYGIAVPGQ
ncbi:MAG: hypothetical protein AMXMBFR64_62180 [Myxococcales bacterium]